ncbi:MAG TPA: YciI family protein [Solirubrobacterales bacterium]|nr:YciI family protein [Solirubrobacterales bacterium]
MKYALLAYSRGEESGESGPRSMHPGIAAVLERPNVTGYLRLEPPQSAGTVRSKNGTTLTTDGPFVESKEFLGGFILVEAESLDQALAVAAELQDLDLTAAIEVRPAFE